MSNVVLDTNALLLPFTEGTDLDEALTALLGAHDLVVPSAVVAELRTLREEGGATGRAAQGALRWLQTRTGGQAEGRGPALRMEETDLPGDDGVLEVARRLQATVLTNDRRLQQEARRSGLKVVRSRGHGRLMRDE